MLLAEFYKRRLSAVFAILISFPASNLPLILVPLVLLSPPLKYHLAETILESRLLNDSCELVLGPDLRLRRSGSPDL